MQTSAPSAIGSYANHGLRIHPLRPGTKLPLLSDWPRRATTAANEIVTWWNRWPHAGVGIATGAGSGVIVIDIDPRHGGDDALADLEHAHGALPPTWQCLTAGGGLHLYLRHPGGTIGNRVRLWPGIDVRADGGYVVAPPTVLADGHGYAWEAGHAPHEVAPADPPAWLLAGLCERTNAAPARPVDEWVVLARDGADVGQRNDCVARLAGYLLRRQPAPRVVLELLRAWNVARCRPPMADAEIVSTVDSIARREGNRRRDGRF